MKKIVSLIFLFLFFASIFFLIITPIEIYNTIDARNWTPVDVRVTSNRLIKIQGGYSLHISVLDLETNKVGDNVIVRYGDTIISLIVFNRLALSTLESDEAQYPVGARVSAFRSLDNKTYVLEQNTVYEMLVILFLSLIYPGVAIWSITKKQTKRICQESKV